MAKGKHAAALFEVIHSDKRFTRSGRASEALRTPRWWFKNQDKQTDAAPDPENQPSAPPSAAPGDPTDPANSPAAIPAPSTPSHVHAAPPSAQPTQPLSSTGIGVHVDSDRQQIAFRFTYTSAAIVAFALFVVVALAYLVGSRLHRGPATATASPSITQLQNEPAHPEVLNVSRTSSTDAPGQSQTPVQQVSSAHTSAATPAAQTAPANHALVTPPGASRTNNLNYVVIQSYPDRSDAEEAIQLLAGDGIGATIEQGLRGLRSDWYTVVGTIGFSRISTNEYKNYLANIKATSDRNFSKKRSFKAFQPMPYKWDLSGQ